MVSGPPCRHRSTHLSTMYPLTGQCGHHCTACVYSPLRLVTVLTSLSKHLKMTDPDFTEYQFRVNRLRLSFKIKNRQTSVQQGAEIAEAEPVHPAFRRPTSSTADNSDSSDQARNFRCRLSSTSSTDSGIAGIRNVSRASSTASRSSNILRRIARARDPTKSAEDEFEGFYRRPVSRTSSSSTTSSSRVVTSPRMRSKSCSSAARGRVVSDDSCYADYSDLYAETEEEYADPFDENKPPPLPPRKPVLKARPPALPPYPSTAVTVVNDIAKTILC